MLVMEVIFLASDEKLDHAERSLKISIFTYTVISMKLNTIAQLNTTEVSGPS
jgi:hypothetical protein